MLKSMMTFSATILASVLADSTSRFLSSVQSVNGLDDNAQWQSEHPAPCLRSRHVDWLGALELLDGQSEVGTITIESDCVQHLDAKT